MSGSRTALPTSRSQEEYFAASADVIDPNNGRQYRDVYKGTTQGFKVQKGFFSFRTWGGKQKFPPDTGQPDRSRIKGFDVGIRPSFYWLDADLSPGERLLLETKAKKLKSDCQDEAVVIEDFAGVKGAFFFGVFDGHGPDGRAVAKFAAAALPAYLAKDPRIWSDDMKKRYKAFKQACYHANEDLQRPIVSHLNAALSGTTACFAVIYGATVCVGSTGDSRCMVVRKARPPRRGMVVEQLSWDAKPEVAGERERIRTKGGVVAQLQDPSGQSVGAYRVFRAVGDMLPGLAMSRSLGDALAHSLGVIAKPAFMSYELKEDDLFLVFGTDGVFDVMDNEQVAELVAEYVSVRSPDVSAADVLTLEAQELWKGMGEEIIVDDTSAIVVHLQPLPPVSAKPKLHVGVKAAYTNDTANALYRVYAQNPDVNPSATPPRSLSEELKG